MGRRAKKAPVSVETDISTYLYIKDVLLFLYFHRLIDFNDIKHSYSTFA